MSEPIPAEAEWRRLDPLMLLVHPVNELGRFLPVVLVAFVFGSTDRDGLGWQWLAVAAPIVLGVARFLMTRYRVTEGRVELRRGLVGRSVLTARLDRVRTVELTATPVHRILGLARVRIGTGAGDNDELELDALRLPAAEALREALLARAGFAPEGSDSPRSYPLLRLDPLWARYAPFTSSGLVIAGAILAGVGQLTDQATGGAQPRVHLDLPGLGVGLLVAAGVVLLGLLAVLAVVGYFVSYGGYLLSTDAQGRTLHVRRGLLTRRDTTLEMVRVRGIELHEPLSLRLVGARRLFAAVTGLGRKDDGGSSLLVPPAPRGVVEHVGEGILRGDPALTMPLRAHGPAARRRRITRALVGALVPAAGLVALRTPWLLVPAVVLVAAALPLALDRYRRLGHGLTDRFLVTRHDSIRGRRVALERTGIIGWTFQQSWFQRRAGLCTLVATTSAGRQAYRVVDVPEAEAIALADAAVPGLVSQFR